MTLEGMMTKQRPCDACGGTGRRYPLPSSNVCVCSHSLGHHRNTGTSGWDSCTWGCGCLDYDAQTAHAKDLCPACSGRGWQSDAMPVADALADAETLRQAAWEYDTRLANVLRKARVLGALSMREVCAETAVSHLAAFDAARAAFRAVPGLRE